MANDPEIKRLFWFIFAGSRGGANRLRIVSAIQERPRNSNQLSKELGLDYKAIQHHIRILTNNNIISKMGEKYGVVYFISNLLELNFDSFKQIRDKMQTIQVRKRPHKRI